MVSVCGKCRQPNDNLPQRQCKACHAASVKAARERQAAYVVWLEEIVAQQLDVPRGTLRGIWKAAITIPEGKEVNNEDQRS